MYANGIIELVISADTIVVAASGCDGLGEEKIEEEEEIEGTKRRGQRSKAAGKKSMACPSTLQNLRVRHFDEMSSRRQALE